jgi:predicted nucleic acid-binding protein
MVLVDTSVWVRFLANRAPYANELDRLLSLDEVAGHELVYGELLIGDRGGRGKLLAAYELMHQARIVPHLDVVEFVRKRKLHGLGIGWIDIHLLASAVVEAMRLWTTDPRLSAMASELGVTYEAPAS